MKFIFVKLFYILLSSFFILSCGDQKDRSETSQTSSERGNLHLFLVRHAQAFKNLNPLPDLPAGQLDSLTAVGELQAAALGRYLKDKSINAIYASPAGRTRQTAEIIREKAGIPDTVIVEQNLISLHKGYMSVTTSQDANQGKNDMNVRQGEGETLADGQQRVIQLIDWLRKQASAQTVVFVTHGDICLALLAYAGATPLSAADSLHTVPAGSVSELKITPTEWIIKSEGVVPAQQSSL